MEKIKELYQIMPHILCIWLILNILGNTIKMTLKIPTKYIIWILLFISITINFVFYGISFGSFFVAIISFSFSVSSYDLVKSSRKLIRKE